jgi:hypothetical protein
MQDDALNVSDARLKLCPPIGQTVMEFSKLEFATMMTLGTLCGLEMNLTHSTLLPIYLFSDDRPDQK